MESTMLYNEEKYEAPPLITTVGDFLNTAADLINKRGLSKYITQDGDNRVCIQGAFNVVATGRHYTPTAEPEIYLQAREAVKNHILSLVVVENVWPGNWGTICAWNNAHDRTKSEVVNMLRKVAQTA
jgi:hypothetical protein